MWRVVKCRAWRATGRRTVGENRESQRCRGDRWISSVLLDVSSSTTIAKTSTSRILVSRLLADVEKLPFVPKRLFNIKHHLEEQGVSTRLVRIKWFLDCYLFSKHKFFDSAFLYRSSRIMEPSNVARFWGGHQSSAKIFEKTGILLSKNRALSLTIISSITWIHLGSGCQTWGSRTAHQDGIF